MKKRKLVSVTSIVAFLAAILAICSTFIIPRATPSSDQARHIITRGDLESLSMALKLYRLDNGEYPTSEAGLAALTKSPGDADDKKSYLERQPLDAWGTTYSYSWDEESPKIASAGPDKAHGTPDDVTLK